MCRVGRAVVFTLLVMAARPRAANAQADTVAVPARSDSDSTIVGPLGIPMRARALGVAYQTLSGADLVDAREPNIVGALTGKVVGADVTNNSTPNGSVHLTLRGTQLLLGDDQPLFVIDGIPVDNSRPRSAPDGGADYGNVIEDIDPNDVASMTVLPGANAAALYGSRAINGVVLITTRSAHGTHGFGLSASQYATLEMPLRLPAFQNLYGQGADGMYSYVDGRGGGVNDGVDESWGPPLDGRLIVQWRSNGQAVPWLPQPDNVRDFFDTGHSLTTTAAVTAAGRKSDVRFGISDMNQHGMLPTNTAQRVTTSLTGGSSLSSTFTVRAALRYARDDGTDRPIIGFNPTNPMTAFIFGGRQLRLDQLRDYALVDGVQAIPTPGSENNPYWDVYANPNADSRDHVIGTVSAVYAVMPWLSVMVRSGTDWYHDRWVQQYGKGNIDMPEGATQAASRHFRENTTDLLVTAARDLSSTLHLTVDAGAARSTVLTSEFLAIGQPPAPPFSYSQIDTHERTTSAYGQARLAYRNDVFLTGTARDDWTSGNALLDDASNLSPSVSGAWVFTDVLPDGMRHVLSNGKLRASWAQVGGVGTLPTVAARTTSWEGGTDLEFANGLVTLSATYYDARTLNRLLTAPMPPLGTNVALGSAVMTSRGVALQIASMPIRRADFEWTVSANFAANRSRVATLPQGMPAIALATSFYTSIMARAGEPYGIFVGSGFARDSLGRVITAGGVPMLTGNVTQGHYAPDWIGGLENQFRYKRVDLSVLFDTKHGGRIFSGTEMLGDVAGVLATSLTGRTPGANGIVVPGVNDDGTPNTSRISAQQYFQSLFWNSDVFVYDASFIKLREVRLGYTLSPHAAANLHLASVRLAAIGRNLWLHTRVPDIDPEATFVVGDGTSMEFLSVPSERSYGLVLNITP